MLQISENFILRRFDLHGQEFLLLTAVDRKHAMVCHFAQRLCVRIVHLINGLGLFIPCRRRKHTFLHRHIPNPAAIIRFI